jgi:hypothetical protein
MTAFRRWITRCVRTIIRRFDGFNWDDSRIALLLTYSDRARAFEILDLDNPENIFTAENLDLAIARVRQLAGRDR